MPKNFCSFVSKITLFFLLMVSFDAFSQKSDSLIIAEPLHASANLNISNNGLSLFPNFSLGRPAVIINLSLQKKGFAFEPELRWGLDGKPWSYIYWFRYRYRPSKKLELRAGVHPAYIFSENEVMINGKPEMRYISQRYAAAEIAPTYKFSDKFSLGVHYVSGRGLDPYAIRSSHFFSVQPSFSNIKLNKDIFIGFNPQVFFLQLADDKGFYFSEYLSINKRNFPVYLSSVFTYKIKSDVAGDKVVWNVGINYKL